MNPHIQRYFSDISRWLGGQNPTLRPVGGHTLDADDAHLIDSLLTQSPTSWMAESHVRNYERAFAAFQSFGYGYSFLTGRTALRAAIRALGLQRGDVVAVPAFTCVAVPNAFRFEGVEVAWFDIETDTFGPDAGSLREALQRNPAIKAVVVQHLFGLVCRDYEAVVALARAHGAAVIEDCTHATGARFRGQRIGQLGDIAFFSSEQSKVINTFTGGMACTQVPELAQRLAEYQAGLPYPDELQIRRLLRNAAYVWHTQHAPDRWRTWPLHRLRMGADLWVTTTPDELAHREGHHEGFRFPAPLAQLGQLQLLKCDDRNAQRREHAQKVLEALPTLPVRVLKWPMAVPDSEPVWLRVPLLVDERDKQRTTWAKKLETEVGHWFSGSEHPLTGVAAGCPNAAFAAAHIVNL